MSYAQPRLFSAPPFSPEFEPAFPSTHRKSRRAPVSFDARVGRGGLDRALCRVTDLSLHGARLITYSPLKRGQEIWLTLPEVGPRIARVMRVDEFEAGVEFETPITEDDFDNLIER